MEPEAENMEHLYYLEVEELWKRYELLDPYPGGV